MADIMERRFDELVEMNMAEAGSARPLAENMQIRPAIDHLRDMAERVLIQYPFEQSALPTHLGGAFSQGLTRQEPFGVAAIITAYNFPFFINVMKLSAALAAGRPAGLDKGYFVEPTLFTGVENSMTIAQEEFFGPVGVIIPFEDDEDAIRIANDSCYGLGGAVRARDPKRAYEIAKRLRTGMVKVNGGAGGISPHSAMGGYKDSGLGREWGTFGLEQYLQTQTIEWRLADG